MYYGPAQIPNEVTVALMTPPANLGSKTLQKTNDNHTTVLHFGVVQGCHKTRFPNPLLYLIYACSSWILKPSTTNAYLPSHHMCPTLQHPKAPLLPKRRPNKLDNEVGTNTLERYTESFRKRERTPRSSLDFCSSYLTNCGAPSHIIASGSHELFPSSNPTQSTLTSKPCPSSASAMSTIPAITNSPCVKAC